MEIVGITSKRRYQIRALTFGERNDILDECHVIREDDKIQLRTGTMRTMTIMRGVLAPKLSRTEVDGLSDEEGRQLVDAINKASKVPLEPSREQSSSTPSAAQTEQPSGKPQQH